MPPVHSRARPAGLTVLAAALLASLLADTAAASAFAYLPFDRPLELAVQGAGWGPLTYAFALVNWTAGQMHAVLGVAAILALWLWLGWERALRLAAGSVASLLESLLKPLIHRPRPTAALVHVHSFNSGDSYPSGHATFYTWFLLLLVAALWPRLPGAWRALALGLALLGALLACLARVYAGAHWPSDVAGGFLLSCLWSLLVAAWLAPRLARWARPHLAALRC